MCAAMYRSPMACPVERTNSVHNKRVASNTRASLKHTNVVKLLYCHVNIRMFRTMTTMCSMVEDALIGAIEVSEQRSYRIDRRTFQIHVPDTFVEYSFILRKKHSADKLNYWY